MKDDQLLVIFKKLGLQTEEDLSFLTNEQMADYAQKLNKGKEKVDFKKDFPENSDILVEVLNNLLCINPFFRASASEALKWDIFEHIRVKSQDSSNP